MEPPAEPRLIKTDPDPFEPFCIAQGYQVGNLIFLSGQAALDLEGNVVGSADFDLQAEQALRNVQMLLDRAGSGLDKLIKVTIYLTDMTHFPKIVELRRKWFTPPYPADTIVEVRSLALPELMIEIDAIALAG
ncbi:MAG: RidA family protein [Pseudomonadales bacterium]|nr:RidA family protein [Pseudomonadales bacterium]NIX09098.1 RidA family protein [Pseudomonadales bacterium]